MKKSVALFVTLALTALLFHFATVFAAPYVVMSAAMKRLSRDDTALNTWIHAPRVSERSRAVVRPSPDLAYSACVYDLKDGPVRVRVAAWDDYMSVSMFQSNTDNFFTINDRRATAGVDLVLVEKGGEHPDAAGVVVESPSRRGIVIQRRLAPTQQRFDAAAAIRASDTCERLDDTSTSNGAASQERESRA